MTPSTPPSRFRELDGLRGLAALSIVISHYTLSYDAKYHSGNGIPFFRFSQGTYGVELFFLISGFVILMTAMRAQHPMDFVVSRVTRLYPAYWISLVLAATLASALDLPYAPHDLLTVLANSTMLQRWLFIPNVNEVYWTLALEMQFYILILILLVITRCRLTDRALAISAISWLIISLAVSAWAVPFSHGLDPQRVATFPKIVINLSLAQYAPLFVTGAFLYLSRSSGRVHPLLIASSAVTFANNILLRDTEHALITLGIVILFALVALRQHTRLLCITPLQWYGKISYSLYVTHDLVGYATMHAILVAGGPCLRDLSMIVAFVVATSAAWIVWKIGEDNISPVWKRRWQARRARIRQTVRNTPPTVLSNEM